MSKGSAPAAPPATDPAAQIRAEAQANRYNVQSPFGTQTWTPSKTLFQKVGDGQYKNTVNGITIAGDDSLLDMAHPDANWTQTTTLDPSQQRQFDERNAIAEQMLGRANTQFSQLPTTPFAYSAADPNVRGASDRINGMNAPSVRTTYGDFAPGQFNPGEYNPNTDDATSRELVRRLSSLSDSPWSANVNGDAVRNAVYQKAKLLLEPTYNTMQERLDQKLTNQGLPIGSEAYGQASDVFGRERSNAYENAAFDAVLQGAQEEQNQFGRALGTRQQNVADIAAGLSGAQSQAAGEFGRYQAGRQQQQGEQAQQYGQALSTRQQQTSDLSGDYERFLQGQQAGQSAALAADQAQQQREITQRQEQYNELAQLLGGQQLNPLNPQNAPIDVSGAYANQQAGMNREYQAKLAKFNADVATQNALIGAGGNLAGFAALRKK